MRLLIAEDDAVTRLHLSAALERMGHEVTATAAAAWEALQKGNLSVVISDWDMPVVDGAELCRRIRATTTDRYVYFILVATRGGKQRYLAGMEAGADDFITKPVDPEELRARIKVAERILSLSRSWMCCERRCLDPPPSRTIFSRARTVSCPWWL